MKTVSGLIRPMVVVCLILILAGMPSAVAQGMASQNVRTASAASAVGLLQFTSGGHALGFTSQGMYAATGSHALHVDFVNANHVQPQADSGISAKDMAAPLGRVTYAGLWNGVNLTYTATPGGIYTTTYTIAPGAEAKNIRLRYNAPITLNKDGTLTVAFATGALSESAPIAWQEIDSQRLPVDVSFQVRGQEVTFAVGAHDPRYVLTIDPSLTWNTFLGGSGNDYGWGIAVDGSGNVYVTGGSSATWGSPVRAYASGSDAFAAKLDSFGGLTWNTFLGGSGDDYGRGIAVDGSGNVYVAGQSYATWGSPVRAYTTSVSDGFAARLNSSGGLIWNTFLGGSGFDVGYAIAVDGSGNVYAAGTSGATWGSPVRAYTGYDAYAAKLNSSGGLTWNTFLGGISVEEGFAIAVDGSGNVYVGGESQFTWGSPVRAYTAGNDVLLAKLNSSGGLTWNTFLGGSGNDVGRGIAVDGSGNVYVAGYSSATWGSPVRAYTSGYDAFAAKLGSSGGLTWNTFLGGSGSDFGNAIAMDGSGNVYVTGESDATWGSPVQAYTAGNDALLAKLNSSGGLTWNTFLGGSGSDFGIGIAVDGSGNVYVTGESDATWGSPVRAYTSGNDGFAAKYNTVIFADVPLNYWALSWIERLYAAGITGGCASNPLRYCPENNVTRAQMAVFLERGMHGASFNPPVVTLTFTDTTNNFARYWIEALKSDGITSGCGPSLYCPDASTTRAEMAVFLLRSEHGASYVPPAASGTLFTDVPASYWAAAWIEQLANEGITSGCGTNLYCPDATVTRAQMAVFLVRTFNLP